MDARILDAGLVAVALGGWALLYGLALLVTRPVSPQPALATQDLGPEPPAVASLLANRWEVTEDAVEATLLDLAARKHLELRQPAGDPMQTTVHIPDGNPVGLTPYERRVLDRVCGLAVGGVLPVTGLTFRAEDEAKRWAKRVRAEIVTDARARGLSRRRFGRTLIGLLVGAAGVAAALVTAAALHYSRRTPDDDVALVFGGGLFTFVLLSGLAARYPGERDTATGREAAARWLGVRAWLRGHDEFANLPPAAVAVWDRYLGYGAGLGATRLASAVLDLGMGNRKLVWSAQGGTWHRVRVRYPRFWRRYGKEAWRLVLRGLVSAAIGTVLVAFIGKPREFAAELDPTLARDRPFDLVESIGLLLGVALLAFGAYVLVRTLIDVATERTITGEVLWVELWRTTPGGENSPPRPVLHYVAVDDGTADRTTAWALPRRVAGDCRDGDTATVRVRRWSRRVLTITVTGRRRRGDQSDSAVDVKL